MLWPAYLFSWLTKATCSKVLAFQNQSSKVYLEWNTFISIQEYLELSLTNNEVILGKFVLNVPSNRAKTPALLQAKQAPSRNFGVEVISGYAET